jgi:short-subunit dehydrogenase
MTAKRHTDSARSRQEFANRYGPWALVAGASEGLGAAYARALAARGLNLVLVARRLPLLEALAQEIAARSEVEICCLDGDLSERAFLEGLQEACAGLEVGLVVYNAAFAPIGEFASTPLDDLLHVAAVNVRAPVTLVRGFLPGMTRRGRGGVILMTSLAGNQGSPYIATYAATKAFNRVLAEGLWYELKDKGVDVLACCAGAVRTPGYSGAAGKDAPGTLDPEEVVEQALRALGRGPVVIPGRLNRLANIFMSRLLPRRRTIAIMAGNTAGLAPAAAPAAPAASATPSAAAPSPTAAAPAPGAAAPSPPAVQQTGRPPTKDAS